MSATTASTISSAGPEKTTRPSAPATESLNMATLSLEESCTLPTITAAEIMELAAHPCLAHITHSEIPRTSELSLEDVLAAAASDSEPDEAGYDAECEDEGTRRPPAARVRRAVPLSMRMRAVRTLPSLNSGTPLTSTPPPARLVVSLPCPPPPARPGQKRQYFGLGLGLPSTVTPRITRRTACVGLGIRMMDPPDDYPPVSTPPGLQSQPRRRPLANIGLGFGINVPR